MANKYTCSDGSKVSESVIQQKLGETYRSLYLFAPSQICHGCGNRAQGTAHIVPKARCKQISKTELIWNPENFFASCHVCNTIAENPESDKVKTLLNYEEILEVTKRFDPERYSKMI